MVSKNLTNGLQSATRRFLSTFLLGGLITLSQAPLNAFGHFTPPLPSDKNLVSCPKFWIVQNESFLKNYGYCDSAGQVREVISTFSSNGMTASIWKISPTGLPSENQIFTSEGVRKGLSRFKELAGGFIEASRHQVDSKEDRIARYLVKIKFENNEIFWQMRERWVGDLYHDFLENSSRWESGFDLTSARVARREVLAEDGSLHRVVNFKYRFENDGTSRAKLIDSYEIFNSRLEKIGHYNRQMPQSILDFIRGAPLSDREIQRRLKIYSDQSRKPVVIIDSGFEMSHPAISHVLYNDSSEPYDGIDNDLDGWVDNAAGWFNDPDGRDSGPSIQERVTFDEKEWPYLPFSHGTHVAGIAFQDMSKFGLVGFAGDYINADFLRKISRYITRKGVRFSNMSFGLSDGRKGMTARGEEMARGALYEMIEKNKQTLFFTAAGNDGTKETIADNDLGETGDWPALIPLPNMFVVAAVGSDLMDRTRLGQLNLAPFSNIGQKRVHAAAPGDKVYSAGLGWDWIRVSGTSMASPWALNIAMRMAEVNSSISNEQIKEILIKTCFVSDLQKPLPVLSGGMIMPERAIKAAQLMLENPKLTSEQASLNAHKVIEFEGERKGASLELLKQFWKSRGL